MSSRIWHHGHIQINLKYEQHFLPQHRYLRKLSSKNFILSSEAKVKHASTIWDQQNLKPSYYSAHTLTHSVSHTHTQTHTDTHGRRLWRRTKGYKSLEKNPHWAAHSTACSTQTRERHWCVCVCVCVCVRVCARVCVCSPIVHHHHYAWEFVHPVYSFMSVLWAVRPECAHCVCTLTTFVL